MLLALEVVTGDEEMARYIYDVSAAVALFDALPNVQEGVVDRMGVSLEDGIVVPNGGWRRNHTRLVTVMREGRDASEHLMPLGEVVTTNRRISAEDGLS